MNNKIPQEDQTGPEGKGPRTGRGLGDCPEPNEDSKESTDEE